MNKKQLRRKAIRYQNNTNRKVTFEEAKKAVLKEADDV